MGEAKRKCAAQHAWLTKLSPAEQHIVEVCKRLHEQLNKRAGFVQACFFYAFFLRKLRDLVDPALFKTLDDSSK